jgi:hypothetical protein
MSFQEQMRSLQTQLDWYFRERGTANLGRIVADFGTATAEAAEELAGWWRSRPEVEVAVLEQRPPTREQIEAAAAHFEWPHEPMLGLRVPDTHRWSVRVTGPSCQDPGFTVKAWVYQLRASPQDARWEYTGGAIEDASARGGEPNL